MKRVAPILYTIDMMWCDKIRLDLLAPVLLALTNVGLVAELSHLLCLGKELVSLLRECFLY